METFIIVFFTILYFCVCVLDFWISKNRPAEEENRPIPLRETKTKSAGYKLLVVDGPQKGKEYVLPPYIIVGRDYKQGISLVDKKVSSKHALITCKKNACHIYDLGSSNKTYVNEHNIDSKELCHGDQILFGSTTMILKVCEPTLREKKPAGNSLSLIPTPATLELPSPVVSIIDDASMTTSIVGRCASTPDMVLDNSKTFVGESLETIRQKFQFMCQISNMVGIGLSIDNLLEETIKALGKLFTKVERGVIFLADPVSDEMSPAISLNFKTRSQENIAVSSTILSEAIEQRMAIMCSNAMSDERFEVGKSVWFQRIKLAMCTPLSVKDELLGAIYLDSTMDTGRFKQDDLALLAAVGAEIAIFVKNARLHQSLLQTEKLQQELAIAQEIQRSFLPSRFPEVEGLQIAAHTRPARYVGGDLYDTVKLSNGRVGITIGDVSGKGAGAALYMAGLVSEFRFLASSGLSPGEVFQALNEKLAARGMRGMFVTIFYMIIDVKNEKMTYANGGHLAPLILKDGYFHKSFPEAQSPPLGIVKHMKFTSRSIPFTRGMSVVMYTDGVTEARDIEREEFGKQRLQQILSEYPGDLEQTPAIEKKTKRRRLTDPLSIQNEYEETLTFVPSNSMTADQFIEYVAGEVANFCGRASQHDDFTMVVAKFQ